MRASGWRRAVCSLGLVIVGVGLACAAEAGASAQAARGVGDAEDTNATRAVLLAARTTDPVACTLIVRGVDQGGAWSRWNGVGSSIVEFDTAAAETVRRVRRDRPSGPGEVAQLTSALRDSVSCVRRVAASLLANVDDVAAREALKVAAADARAGVREASAIGMGLAEDTTSAETLLGLLRDREPQVRRAAAWALGVVASPGAEGALVRLLAGDPDARVRQAAAWALGAIGGE